ncbi:MAG: SagB/ThcOx family dehydrogenase [Planctomycetaceae bacterium]|jgi:nitroreductase|nr:SagB/ThcOx family dehydrogenase [Planctomycetaceae bacterium]
MKTLCTFVTVFTVVFTVSAQDITLPAPQTTGGKPLFDAISARQTTRDFSDKDVELQDLSDLLWSAYGFNREDRRVIPTPKNSQEISVYVFLKNGVYLYDAKANTLIHRAAGDRRKDVGTQDYVYSAPVNFLYMADSSKEMGTASYVAVGCAAQDVYLAAASKGLGAVVRTGGFSDPDKVETLRKMLKLTKRDVPIAGQTVGHKK